MENIYNKKIQSIEKKIKFLNGLLIVGIIISIIGVLGLVTTLIRSYELQHEESDMQRLSEIGQELEKNNIKILIFIIFFLMGPPIFSLARDFKRRFSKLKESYLDQYETHSEPSFIIDLKED